MHTRGSEKATSGTKDGPAEAIDSPIVASPDNEGACQEVNGQDSLNDGVTKEYQHGVQGAQALTQLWGKKQLILAYIL